MTEIRPATPEDAEDLARIHVQAWSETYTGLLPDTEIAARSLMVRLRQWQNAFAKGHSRVALLPGQGFAQAGPQRSPACAAYPQELYALYLTESVKGQGQGRALLRAVSRPGPMSAWVLEGNAKATGFYLHTGGHIALTRDDHVGKACVREHLITWPDAALI